MIAALGRAIFALGWITTGFMLAGFTAAIVVVFKRRRDAVWPAFWSVPGAAVTMMAALVSALILFTYTYRNEGAMKAMYMYPALLCAVWAFAYGIDVIRVRVGATRIAAFDTAAGISVVAVCALYVAQLIALGATIVLNGM